MFACGVLSLFPFDIVEHSIIWFAPDIGEQFEKVLNSTKKCFLKITLITVERDEWLPYAADIFINLFVFLRKLKMYQMVRHKSSAIRQEQIISLLHKFMEHICTVQDWNFNNQFGLQVNQQRK